VDEVVAYVAPMLLGAGRNSVGALGIETIADALRLEVTDVGTLGTGTETNLRLTMRPTRRP
jgi:diaminohydroxyphosphoribosylaminopyrimidine deaminase/5-amino-6-(5-phosphoribosylamino)uracil reductase